MAKHTVILEVSGTKYVTIEAESFSAAVEIAENKYVGKTIGLCCQCNDEVDGLEIVSVARGDENADN